MNNNSLDLTLIGGLELSQQLIYLNVATIFMLTQRISEKLDIPLCYPKTSLKSLFVLQT